MQVGNEQQAGRLDELRDVGRFADLQIETVVESRIELSEVRPDAELSGLAAGLDDPDIDEPCGQQSFDRRHRFEKLSLRPFVERAQQRVGELVAATVDLGSLGVAGVSEPYQANPLIVSMWLDGDEALALEHSQQPAEVAGVEVESGPERAGIAAVGGDLPQQPRSAERPLATEVVVAQCADSLGNRAIEAPDMLDLIGQHFSDVSQRYFPPPVLFRQALPVSRRYAQPASTAIAADHTPITIHPFNAQAAHRRRFDRRGSARYEGMPLTDHVQRPVIRDRKPLATEEAEQGGAATDSGAHRIDRQEMSDEDPDGDERREADQ